MSKESMPSELRVRLRGFFRNSRHMIHIGKQDAILRKMSTSLWGETCYLVAKRSLSQVPYLVASPDVEPEFLLAVSTKLKEMVRPRGRSNDAPLSMRLSHTTFISLTLLPFLTSSAH